MSIFSKAHSNKKNHSQKKKTKFIWHVFEKPVIILLTEHNFLYAKQEYHLRKNYKKKFRLH